ncbi:YdcF family protein [Rhizobium sp. B230/85]|uniref:YdcF family protein n=1 Tax=unclassified Rhizobium TaxID=2613769 RepID=UPI001ADA4619|nr:MULTISPECIES: YdcF family protein [unclassified Rhizobium]MBO9135367.1 YdcF family protein [Rhizobium sp. B209b/85]QXZ98831.1 YdcF family protein [Rhizobium sp. B230/85]
MFLIFYQLVASVFLPSNLIALLGLLGIAALLLRWKCTASWLLGTSSVLLCIAGWSPVGPAVLTTLEDRFTAPDLPDYVTGIVMLGGAEEAHITASRNSLTLNNNAERIFQTAALARRYPQARIILSGGGGHLVLGEIQTEAEIAQRVLVDLGIASERIETERRSQTTYENAVQSMAVAKPQPSDNWLLVTSAYNMPRAVASFRAVGFITVPYPVDYRTRTAEFKLPFSTIAEGLDVSDTAAHEWLGLAAYRLTGKTQTFLPAAN